MTDRLHVLFVCSRNAWRSPTAERVWRDGPRLAVRSAGTSPRARRTVSARDLAWADLVLVMESRHRERLLQRFGDAARRADVRVLGIEDDYGFMDPELVERLRDGVAAALRGLV